MTTVSSLDGFDMNILETSAIEATVTLNFMRDSQS
jgi:hypothetical protein